MTPTRLLLGQIVVVFAIIILGVWFATQWTAASFAYQPELGPAWFLLFGHRIYAPWALFDWWFHYEAYAPAVFNKAGLLAGATGFVGCGAAVAGSLWRARTARHVTTYGSAQWATAKEIARLGLFREAGVFLGKVERRFLRHDGPEHVMAFAPTRSGKGVGLVVPTLLSWTGSAIIHDIKGENWELTAGWRALFSHCLLFDPTNARSAHFNPLIEVRRGPNEVRDAQNIADILVDPVISTDRRIYHVALSSTPATAMAALSWTYPQDELIALRRATEKAEAVAPVAAGIDIEQLHFNYTVSGDTPGWRPLRAFDDGQKTFIEFPPSLSTGDAPPLFVVGAKGEAELVNYRVRGRYYVVDRLFDTAELRLGLKHQSVVRISRTIESSASRRGA